MKMESLIHKILRKLGFIKDIEDDRKLKMEMCKRAIKLRDESLREKRGGRND